MKLLISPAKSLEFEKELPLEKTTTPVFVEDASYINSILKEQSVADLSKLMHLSESLATLNWDRNQSLNLLLPNQEQQFLLLMEMSTLA
jgi:cytoplasmic iron level regulating protein YaaA (DUF328/UPF0246 family)